MNLMVQGTMSGVGKSLITTALCRIFMQDGYRVAPFKSQNMALNSFVTPDGLEIGRAQAVQAEAAGLECDVRMNPILLKPSSEMGSQLIVNGEIRGQYNASAYFQMKKSLLPEVLNAYSSLSAENDIIVIEGAGSPAEINLRKDDIVNMGLATLLHAPVMLVGDINPGGVFAQLYGTVSLLREVERSHLIGTVINKFRGDLELLRPGLSQLEDLTGLPVLGVIPWHDFQIDDEDSMSPMLLQRELHNKPLDFAVIRLPHISNFTDFRALEFHPYIGLRFTDRPELLGHPDLILLPGTKSTIDDLLWLHKSGLDSAILHLADEGTAIIGICGGYQMLGTALHDPSGVEHWGSFSGLGLLPVETHFSSKKTRYRRQAMIEYGPFAGASLEGFEIHMGRTEVSPDISPFCHLSNGAYDGAQSGNIFGTYLHGLFDSGELIDSLVAWLSARKGIPAPCFRTVSRLQQREREFDRLATHVRHSLDLNYIMRSMEQFSNA